MLVEADESSQMCFSFVVYDPPAPGLPWRTVCLGPHGRVIGAETFDTAEAVRAEVERQAALFKANVKAMRPRVHWTEGRHHARLGRGCRADRPSVLASTAPR